MIYSIIFFIVVFLGSAYAFYMSLRAIFSFVKWSKITNIIAFAVSIVLFFFWGWALAGTAVTSYLENKYWSQGFLLLVLSLIVYGILNRIFNFLANTLDTTVLKGSAVVSGKELQNYLFGEKVDLTETRDIIWGDVAIPYVLENQHFLLSGTTGSGKTQAINRALKSVRARGKKAIIADPAGGFYARFGERSDILINPFDRRSVGWSPFAEIRTDYDCQRLANAAIPEGSGDSKEWHFYARTLLGETLLALYHRGEYSVKTLLHLVSSASSEELASLLAGTPANILTVPGNEKMLNNTRAIIATYLNAWRFLPDRGSFSIRKWVQDDHTSSWLFITYRDDQMQMLREFVASLLDLAIVEGLSLSEDTDRDLWYVFDEVDSLGKITSLRAGLTKLRKYGGKVLLGLQTISQLRSTYGKDEAQTLLANTSIKLILRAGDNETANYFSQELGEQEINQAQYSTSTGTSSGHIGHTHYSKSSSTSYQIKRQSTVMASEIMGLPDLSGYLKLPDAPIGQVALVYEALDEKQGAFVP